MVDLTKIKDGKVSLGLVKAARWGGSKSWWSFGKFLWLTVKLLAASG